MEKKRDIEDVPDWELFHTMIDELGLRRTVELMGWATFWGLTGQIDNMKAARESLEAQGLSRAACYRAIADYKRLKDLIESREAAAPFSVQRFILRLANIKPAQLSLMGEDVVK